MAEYIKTSLADIISVDSVITVFHKELYGTETPLGESHNFWEFVYVDSGTFEVSVDNQHYTVEEGQLIVYAPLAFHIGAKPNNVKIDIVSFEATFEEMAYFANKVITLTGKQRQSFSEIIAIGEKHFKACSKDIAKRGMVPREETDLYTLQRLKNHLELLLIDLFVTNKNIGTKPKGTNYENHTKKTFDTLTQFLKKHMSEALTLETLCSHCAVSLSTLKRVCREHCGMSPMSYFISLKIDTAKAMICDTDLNITQISEKLGFSTVHYFSKLFKDKVGLSPSEYAKAVYKK